MKVKILFTFHSIAALAFGICFVVFASFMTDLLGVPTNAIGQVGWRFFGIAIIAVAILAFGSRNRTVSELRTSVILSMFFVFVALLILKFILAATSIITLNIWMWLVIAFHLLMAVWYGYFLLKKS